MKKKPFFAFLAALVALVLECLPWGAVLRFAQPEGDPVRKTYSYFSLTPYGYANFFPLLTAILTTLLAVYLLISFFSQKEKTANTCFYLAFVGAILSLLPLLRGIQNFSIVGLGISLSLGVAALLLFDKSRLK